MSTPGKAATVEFYIAINNGTTEPSKRLTDLVSLMLAELIAGENTAQIGANFGEGAVWWSFKNITERND